MRASIDVIRAAAVELVERSSLRVAATTIGLHFQALRRFMQGGRPHGKNEVILRAWYEQGPGEMERLRRENERLRKALADCEANQKRSK